MFIKIILDVRRGSTLNVTLFSISETTQAVTNSLSSYKKV